MCAITSFLAVPGQNPAPQLVLNRDQPKMLHTRSTLPTLSGRPTEDPVDAPHDHQLRRISAGYPPDIMISGKSGYPPNPAHDPPDMPTLPSASTRQRRHQPKVWGKPQRHPTSPRSSTYHGANWKPQEERELQSRAGVASAGSGSPKSKTSPPAKKSFGTSASPASKQ